MPIIGQYFRLAIFGLSKVGCVAVVHAEHPCTLLRRFNLVGVVWNTERAERLFLFTPKRGISLILYDRVDVWVIDFDG